MDYERSSFPILFQGFAESGPRKTYVAIAIWVVYAVALYMWLAVNVKRCHDRGHSGWFVLLSLIPVVNIWYVVEVGFLPGQSGPNRFGPDPKASTLTPIFSFPSSPETLRRYSLRNNQLEAKLLRPFGQRSDLLFAVSGFIVFGSFVHVLVSVADEPIKETG